MNSFSSLFLRQPSYEFIHTSSLKLFRSNDEIASCAIFVFSSCIFTKIRGAPELPRRRDALLRPLRPGRSQVCSQLSKRLLRRISDRSGARCTCASGCTRAGSRRAKLDRRTPGCGVGCEADAAAPPTVGSVDWKHPDCIPSSSYGNRASCVTTAQLQITMIILSAPFPCSYQHQKSQVQRSLI